MKLFVTTKNLDYIRNVQEIALLTRDNNGMPPDVIGSAAKGYLPRMAKVLFKLFTTRFSKYDEIFVGFAPQLVIPLFAGRFKRYKAAGGRVTIDFFISVYDTFVNDRKKIKDRTAAARFTRWLDRKALFMADSIIVDTKAHGRYFTEEFGACADKIRVLYLEADKSVYYPRGRTTRNKESDTSQPRDLRNMGRPHDSGRQKIVLYFASMLPLQGAEVVLEAARLMKDMRGIRFVIIGPVKEKLIQDNITYIDWLSQNELSDAIAEADLCLAGHFNGSIGKASRTIPGKAYIYRAMEKPMILGDNPANREIFDESQTGIGFCKMGDAQSLKSAITSMLEKDVAE